MGGTEGGDGEAGLRPCGGVFGMGVDDAADGGEGAIEQDVGDEIGGGAEGAFDDVAVEVGEDDVGGGELVVGDAGGLDGDDSVRTADAGGVTEGKEREAAANDFEICVEDLLAELRRVS